MKPDHYLHHEDRGERGDGALIAVLVILLWFVALPLLCYFKSH